MESRVERIAKGRIAATLASPLLSLSFEKSGLYSPAVQ
jgi:hypothetical protein